MGSRKKLDMTEHRAYGTPVSLTTHYQPSHTQAGASEVSLLGLKQGSSLNTLDILFLYFWLCLETTRSQFPDQGLESMSLVKVQSPNRHWACFNSDTLDILDRIILGSGALVGRGESCALQDI